MNGTLYRRFQGMFWGAAIAKILVKEPSSTSSLTWETFVFQGCQQLIEWGTFSLPDLPWAQPWEVTGLLLPLSLYFHEDREQLQLQWRQIVAHYQLSSDWQTAGLAIALTLATLIEATEPNQTFESLHSQVRSLLPQFAQPSETGFAEQQENICRQTPPEIQPLIFGLACFCHSPHSFAAAIALAQQTPTHQDRATRIAASLCGAYQTRVGIPVPWQLLLKPLDQTLESDRLQRPTNTRADLNRLSRHLLASWSGADLSALHSRYD